MPPNTKECPYCAEDIKAAAIVCRYCGRDLPPAAQRVVPVPARRRKRRNANATLLAAFVGSMFALTCCGILALLVLVFAPATSGTVSAPGVASALLEPLIVRPTAPPIETILGTVENMTDAQRNAYNESLRGSRVEGWRGVVSDVDEGEFFGGFSVFVDMVDGNLFSEAHIDVPEDVALALNKGQTVVFSGDIATVSDILGTTVFIENATIVPVE